VRATVVSSSHSDVRSRCRRERESGSLGAVARGGILLAGVYPSRFLSRESFSLDGTSSLIGKVCGESVMAQGNFSSPSAPVAGFKEGNLKSQSLHLIEGTGIVHSIRLRVSVCVRE